MNQDIISTVKSYSKRKRNLLILYLFSTILISLLIVITAGLQFMQIETVLLNIHYGWFFSATLMIFFLTIVGLIIFENSKVKIINHSTYEEFFDLMKMLSSSNGFLYGDVVEIIIYIIISKFRSKSSIDEANNIIVNTLKYLMNPDTSENMSLRTFAFNNKQGFSEFCKYIIQLKESSKDIQDYQRLILAKYTELAEYSSGHKISYREKFLDKNNILFIIFVLEIILAVAITLLMFVDYKSAYFNIVAVVLLWLSIINKYFSMRTKKLTDV